ncbi:MULE domain-containing protein [Aphis craccivora]|uniref:MULE domain-containing protein n=1 Tax=Aphis craccivora TaxID=307492 RepID=A0A6G0Y5B7_APHCR|nr:MULE domain-containing protein [Aphis craccivora]
MSPLGSLRYFFVSSPVVKEIKIGYVCPSRIRLHKKESNINVQYYSTHLWHTNGIGQLRLHKNDRSQLAGKLSMGVPVQRILNDVQEINITYSTKHHENDAVSVKLWVDRMKCKGDHSAILYIKQQGE